MAAFALLQRGRYAHGLSQLLYEYFHRDQVKNARKRQLVSFWGML